MSLKSVDKRKRRFAYFVALSAGSLIAVCNPVVLSVVLNPGKTILLYWTIADVLLFVVFIVSIRYQFSKGSYGQMIVVTTMLIPLLILLEIGILWGRSNYRIQLYREQSHQLIARPSKKSGWELIPNSRPSHISQGNFNVIYGIDEKGRRYIPNTSATQKTIHFFGDSIMFGYGVNNDETALSILSERLGPTIAIYNWSVPGYGLEQMLTRIQSIANTLNDKDTVVLSPTSYDVERNLIDKSFVCAHLITESFDYFPVLVDGKLVSISVSGVCNMVHDTLLLNSKMPFGYLYSLYWKSKNRNAILKNGRDLIEMASEIAHSKNANFELLLVVSPRECLQHRHHFPLDKLGVAYSSLLEYCPNDAGELSALGFSQDNSHFSVRGNRWLAETIELILTK